MADSISRNYMQIFRELAPEADRQPTEIPTALKVRITKPSYCLSGRGCYQLHSGQPSKEFAEDMRIAQNSFILFCNALKLPPLPTTERVLILYVAVITASVPDNHQILRSSHMPSSFDVWVARPSSEGRMAGTSATGL